MNVLVFSDSHKKLTPMIEIIEKYPEIHTIFHLGDHFEDAMELKDKFPNKTFHCVIGNNDFATSPILKKVELGEYSVLLCHSHTLEGKYHKDKIKEEAKQQGCEMAFYGHTHKSCFVEVDGILIGNPGSISRPLDGNPPSYGILQVEEKDFSILFYEK